MKHLLRKERRLKRNINRVRRRDLIDSGTPFTGKAALSKEVKAALRANDPYVELIYNRLVDKVWVYRVVHRAACALDDILVYQITLPPRPLGAWVVSYLDSKDSWKTHGSSDKVLKNWLLNEDARDQKKDIDQKIRIDQLAKDFSKEVMTYFWHKKVTRAMK